MRTLKNKTMKAADFDEAFENGDVVEHLNQKSVKVHYPVQRISIDFPRNIIEEIDVEAAKIGVARTSLIKVWVAQQLEKQHAI